MMFISFLYPYKIRDIEAPYLWVFYKQINHFSADEIAFIGDEDYFKSPDFFISKERWETMSGSFSYNGYYLPTQVKLNEYDKYFIDKNIFKSLEKQNSYSANLTWNNLILNRNEILEEKLIEVIKKCMDKYGKIEAILTWCNCASLNYVANKFAIKVIHNEVGPLRKPLYTHTAYFDFSGVNGNTESKKRYQQFENLEKNSKNNVPVFKREDLLNFFLEYPGERDQLEDCYDIGVALQVEDDSNIIAYSNGLDSYTLLQSVTKHFSKEKILIRKHPNGHVDYSSDFGVLDQSVNSIEFIKKCKQICTINSSVGIEAVLHGKPSYILGDNPFLFMTDDSFCGEKIVENYNIRKLNFALFGYIIPYDLLFNIDYYRWRLTMPDESEIYLFHLKYYLRRLLILNIKRDSTEIIIRSLLENNVIAADFIKEKIMLFAEKKFIKELLVKKQKEKERIIEEKERIIEEKEQIIEEKERIIEEINNSNGYKLLKKYYHLRNKILNNND